MEDTEWNAGKILGISGSYWQAFALHAGVKLCVFTIIGEDVSSASEIAQKLSCDLRGLTMLLNALSAMGLLIKKQDKYANTDVSKLFLIIPKFLPRENRVLTFYPTLQIP